MLSMSGCVKIGGAAFIDVVLGCVCGSEFVSLSPDFFGHEYKNVPERRITSLIGAFRLYVDINFRHTAARHKIISDSSHSQHILLISQSGQKRELANHVVVELCSSVIVIQV